MATERVVPIRCCKASTPPALGKAKGLHGIVGVFLHCPVCDTFGPTVSMEDVGKSNWWNVAARAWNRKMFKREMAR